MTADQGQRPNITELCQMMVDVLMAQLDFMREKDHVNTMEIKQLKDRVRIFEGPTSTGFKGFSTIEAQQFNMGTTQAMNNSNYKPPFSPINQPSGMKQQNLGFNATQLASPSPV